MRSNFLYILTPQGGQAVAYAYDTMGRLTDITKGTDAFTYSYTGVNSLVQSLTRPNGSVTDYSYDTQLKWLDSITNNNSSSALINSFSFTHNDKDLIDNETAAYGYTVNPPNLPAGVNIYQNNLVNQLQSETSPARTYIYDDDGNMTQGYTPAGHQMTMAYDAENRLISASYNDGTNDLETRYFYSGNNLLARVEKWDDTGNPGTLQMTDETRFVRNGFLEVQERDGSNAVTREYIWGQGKGGGIGGLLSMKDSADTYYYLYDGKGNVSAVIDDSNPENVVASYRYDAFGNLIDQSGTLDQPFKFSTKRFDEDTGLYYYGYRYYSPSIGKWITRDPIGEDGGINLYGFVGNDAVNRIDPLGLKKWCGSGKSEKWVPEYPFSGCCEGHDKCYGCEGKAQGISKKDCDQGFCLCMVIKCLISPWINKEQCLLQATIYCIAVVRSEEAHNAFRNAREGCGGSC